MALSDYALEKMKSLVAAGANPTKTPWKEILMETTSSSGSGGSGGSGYGGPVTGPDQYANIHPHQLTGISSTMIGSAAQTMPKDPESNPVFNVRRIRNGYILRHARSMHEIPHEDYCGDMNEVGRRVTAVLVEYELKEK